MANHKNLVAPWIRLGNCGEIIFLGHLMFTKAVEAQNKAQHSLANHGMFPDKEDMRELVVYVTLLFIVLSWMLREVQLAFFTQDNDPREMRRNLRNTP